MRPLAVACTGGAVSRSSTLLVALADVQEQTGDFAAAIDTLQQVVVSDPVHEEAQGMLMRLLVQTGRRHLALRQYQALRAAVQRELEAEPDVTTPWATA